MPRALACLTSVAALAVFTFIVAGCGAINTAPMPSSSVHLRPNPPHIYVAPFNTETAKFLIGHERDGVDTVDFKRQFTTQFQHILIARLNKMAPTEARWVDDLPDHGWLVAGEFLVVDQGSRFLRTAIGAGLGQTTFETQVYVYDLDTSKTQYVLSFRTGVPDADNTTGAGSGSAPSGVSTAGEPVTTAFGLGSGLKQDSTRTADAIADVLSQYK